MMRSIVIAFFFSIEVSAFLLPHLKPKAFSNPLWMGKVKRGKLGLEVDADAPSTPKQLKRKRPAKTKKTGSNKGGSSSEISPALAEWMKSQDNNNDDDIEAVSTGSDTKSITESVDDAITFTSFEEDTKSKKKSKRIKQSARKAAEEARDQQVQALVEELQGVLEAEKKEISEILAPVQQLMNLPSGNFRQLTSGSSQQDFRLAWVGSDDAICHLCTGLHKVPLARLQEVFLTFAGRNRVEVNEVIRIIGPFPNVKNILQGSSALGKKNSEDMTLWKVSWDSMVDGTGKELLAGKEENIRMVDLQIYFSDPSVVVAVVPPNADDTSERRSNPLEEDGKHILVFVREENLDDQLEILRVA